MRQQYLRLFSFLIGSTFIISGVVFTFVNDYKAMKKRELEAEIVISEKITEKYEEFYNKEKDLNTFREEYLSLISEFSSYFQEMSEGYPNIIEKIDEYENVIKDIDENAQYLKDVCTKRYSVLEANDKCDAFYINLEKSINYFISDLTIFNTKIKEYNEWIEEENESISTQKKYEELDTIKAKKYTDYVDLNEDGTYLGKPSE